MPTHSGPRAKKCKTYKELKEVSPTLGDGVYTLFPNGEESEGTSVFCLSSGSHHYQAVFRNFGGPIYSTFGSNVSNNTLLSNLSTYNGDCSTYDYVESMSSQVNEICYNYWKNLDNVVWYKRIRNYNSSGNQVTTDARYTSDIWLKYYENATFNNTLQTSPGDIGGYVSMSFNNSGTFYDYGVTRYRASNTSTNTIGFANDTDNANIPIGEPVMGGQSIFSSAGWEARHVISYVHSSTGRDTVRCQFKCWTGNEGVATDMVWFVREKEDNE